MKQAKIRILCILICLVFLPACAGGGQGNVSSSAARQGVQALDAQRTEELHTLAETFTHLVAGGDTEAAMAMTDEETAAALNGKLAGVWEQLLAAAGAFVQTGAYAGTQEENFQALEMTLHFEGATFVQRTVFNEENLISGLWFSPGEVPAVSAPDVSQALPAGLREIAVTVDAGEGYPLDGLLTMPDAPGPVPAVVLVHGSGPSDKNATLGPNAPLRDIAYALAQQGVAVLRYDKRTYAYGQELAQQADPRFTVEEETVADAVAALALMQGQDGIDKNNIYLLGHSMGGGLLSYIHAQGGECAGYIILAGTPRKLWELSAGQNLLLADELEQAGEEEKAEEVRALVEQELLKAEGLASLPDTEALSAGNAIFGMSAWYLRAFARIDAAALHLADSKPVLVLQGESDRQVSMEDFRLWRQVLAAHPSVQYISYPALNHLFGHYTGDPVPLSQLVAVEYAQRTPVAGEVTGDIAAWILQQSGTL